MPTSNYANKNTGDPVHAVEGGQDQRSMAPQFLKRAKTPYMLFSQVNWKRVRKESPEVSFVKVGDLLGIMWTNLAETEKAVYVKMARNDAERYEKKLCCDRAATA
ncbi:hypothetical protein DL89DRAFT_104059 [Linderina pennispora]|uniref:HMG box domain-containing protein n=1 Tax=Linderina pennispora TaxID=61395 RepID=A0A1Y1WEH7_9FUNG|nr:uncharacterized protein DL89DRAFT_104059 [Linderina pennispora]ORX71929.1 hypothetical protein DL89DRAFT_104059 [Linderina pennispora]